MLVLISQGLRDKMSHSKELGYKSEKVLDRHPHGCLLYFDIL